MYRFTVGGETKCKNRCKGIKSSVVKSEIKTKDYVNTLYTHEPKFIYQNGIRSYEHELYAETQYKKTLSCNRCGYNDYRALEFHHFNNDKDEFDPCVIARKRSWKNVINELNKCEVLCSNCHRIEHYIGH
jgi:hypothetical protein